MRRRIFPILALPILILAAVVGIPPFPASARESPLPHLIQTVTERDIYEGMLALGFLRTPVLERPDCAAAYENVKNCVVRVQMGNAHGSGIIWEMTPEEVVVATNRHVLAYWQDEYSYVYFPQGYYAQAQVAGVSEECDVGFLTVASAQFACDELEAMRSVRVDETVYGGLGEGDTMFLVDAGLTVEEARYFEGTVGDTHKYIEDFDAYMLYGHGFAKEGMSGGGAFDGRGYLIGMVTGGTYHNETASVPLADLVEAYEAVMGEKIH